MSWVKTPQNVQISVSSHIRTIFEGAYKPNFQIFGIFGMGFDGIVSGCLHWMFQWSHLKAYKMKQRCVMYMYLRRISLTVKREAKNICINLVHALVANQMFDTIFTSFCSALMSESVYYAHWIFIFLRSRFHSAWVKFHPLFHNSAQSGKSAAIIVSKSSTCTDIVIS